ncbi:hypothetical protein QQ045_011339 [Rhodiola kirilowii]
MLEVFLRVLEVEVEVEVEVEAEVLLEVLANELGRTGWDHWGETYPAGAREGMMLGYTEK